MLGYFFSSMKHNSQLDSICKSRQHFTVKILKKRNPLNGTVKRKYRPDLTHFRILDIDSQNSSWQHRFKKYPKLKKGKISISLFEIEDNEIELALK